MGAPAELFTFSSWASEWHESGNALSVAGRGSHGKRNIIRLLPEDGAGYICGDAGEKVFFHWSVVRDLDFCSLRPGMGVLFRAGTQKGSTVALEVRCLALAADGGPFPGGERDLPRTREVS